MAARTQQPIIQLRGIRKSFANVEVLHGVDFELYAGEVHALVGENGAGKSTLAKIISGVYTRDAGEYLIDGKPVKFKNTQDAIAHNISIMHQEFNLIPAFNVADNIFLNNEPMKGIFVDKAKLMEDAKKLADQVKLSVPLGRLVRDLTVAQQQLVEISKCLSVKSRVVIMDEPTAPLSINETEKLFSLIEELKAQGIAIIYISHRMDEIFRISDRVTVMRDGELVGVYKTRDLTRDSLIQHMVGRDLSNMYTHTLNQATGEVMLRVSGLNCRAKRLKNLSFELRRGEILGFAGLVGAGRTELMECIFGLQKFETGEIEIKGKRVAAPKISQMMAMGMGYVPEDRKKNGIITSMNVQENLTLASLKNCLTGGLLSRRKELNVTEEIVQKLHVRCAQYTQKLVNLSGGNQQKISVGKWLSTDMDILILDEPTRGVDVGAKAEIYQIMSDICNSGISIIMISSEMPEIIGMCSRVLVMCEGCITGELKKEELNEFEIMRLAVQRDAEQPRTEYGEAGGI